MDVYTFYEPIASWDHDRSLLDLWVKNWSDKGFNPVIMSLNDAKKHNYYLKFSETISKSFKTITKKDIINPNNAWSYYVYYNYIRFLSYATIDTKQPILIMDYDVYNINLNPEEISGLSENIFFYWSICPCLMTGSPASFGNLCKMFAFVTENHLDLLEEEYKLSPYVSFHEMALMHLLKFSKNKILNQILEKYNINFAHDDHLISTCLYHSSNVIIREYCNNNSLDIKSLNHEQKINIRIRCAKEKINNANI